MSIRTCDHVKRHAILKLKYKERVDLCSNAFAFDTYNYMHISNDKMNAS